MIPVLPQYYAGLQRGALCHGLVTGHTLSAVREYGEEGRDKDSPKALCRHPWVRPRQHSGLSGVSPTEMRFSEASLSEAELLLS